MSGIDYKNAVRLKATSARELRAAWRPWKKLGYRVTEADGVTIIHEKEAIRRRVLAAFEGIEADIFLFGSQVDGSARRGSDYDVGYYAVQPVPSAVLGYLAEELEELPIPARVDLVDFSRVREEFASEALKKVEIWKKRQMNSLFG